VTAEHDAVAELFGLAGTFPRPGWVVLDAARDHRFTGELVFETTPVVRMYFDRGRIYLAERVTDPSLGARLVDAGALNAAQLERGAMRFGDDEHLGRLFERVPSVDRHAVLVTTELMTEECIGWLAGQNVRSVESAPYRRHPSGVHRWDRPDDVIELHPGDPLPAPAPDEAPIEVAPPEPLFAPGETVPPFGDDILQWNEPSFYDERPVAAGGARADAPPQPEAPPQAEAPPQREADRLLPATDPRPAEPEHPLAIRADWVDRLVPDGLPEPASDPLAAPTRLPPVPTQPSDRFEIIWPSGQVDEQFGSDAAPLERRQPDLDRAGPTARLGGAQAPGHPTPTDEPSVAANGDAADHDDVPTDAAPDAGPAGEGDDGTSDGASDEVVLAVRRAVASIETGGLAARRRLAGNPVDADSSRGVDLVPPGRVAVRDEPSDWSPGAGAVDRRVVQAPVRSVFDDLPARSETSANGVESAGTSGELDDESSRSGALRRLIGSLRRR
jgi:hypothetical protein